MRFAWIVIALALLLVIPFLIWGETFADLWTTDRLASYGSWAWLLGVALLIGDILAPTPSTAIMSGLGLLYGVWLGGAIGALGSIAAGVIAYGLARAMGRNVALKLTGAEDLGRGEQLFRRSGAWLVAISRWLPLLAEVIACLAGITRMRFRVFITALACGSVPLAFVFAYIGAQGHESPHLVIVVNLLAPPLLWLTASQILKRKTSRKGPDPTNTQNTK